MRIELYDISNPEGVNLKTYISESKEFYLDLEIYIKINNGEEGIEMYDTSISNIEGFVKYLKKNKISTTFFLPKGILCHNYNYDDLYHLVDNYIKSIKPKNIGELGLLMNNLFEYHDSFFDNKINEMKHYMSLLKK